MTMSLTVSCLTCRDDDNPRRIVSWAQSCSECADLCVANHRAEFPGHRLEITGFISERPFGGAQQNIQRILGRRESA